MVTSTMQSVAGEKAPRRRRSPRSRCRLSWTGVVLGVVLGVAPLRVLAAAALKQYIIDTYVGSTNLQRDFRGLGHSTMTS